MTELPSAPDPAMKHSLSSLDLNRQEATPRLINRLHAAGVLGSEGRQAALKLVNGPVVWWSWIETALLFLGLALTLSGVVCFFAWNWSNLPGLIKLGIVQTGIVTCCVLAWQKKLDTLQGKAAITGAAVLVGVCLAVFGQIYQTGADAYQLFVGWALLILPWVLMCRLAGLWILWLAIVNLGVALFWEQTIDFRGLDSLWLPVILGLLNGTAAAIREVLVARGCSWLPVWFRRILVMVALAALVVPGFVVVADIDDAHAGAWCGLMLFLLSLVLLYWQFRRRTPDLFVLTCAATAVTVLSCAIVIRLLVEVGDEVVAFFLSGLVILGLVALMTHWLIKTGREIREASAVRLEAGGSLTSATPVADTDRDDADDTPQLSIGQLLTTLSDQGLLSEDDIEKVGASLVAESREDRTPWFVQALIGFGAWLSCLLFLGALAIAGLFEAEAAAEPFWTAARTERSRDNSAWPLV